MNTLHSTADGLRFRISAPTLAPFTNALPASTAPRTATEAAALIATQGEHVHVVSEGEAHCPASLCTPAIVAGLLGATPRSRPYLDSPHPLT
jgi:hypothetical protein